MESLTYNLDNTTDPLDIPSRSSIIGGPKHRELIYVSSLDETMYRIEDKDQGRICPIAQIMTHGRLCLKPVAE